MMVSFGIGGIVSSLAFYVHFLGGILSVLAKVMLLILLGANLSNLKSNFCSHLHHFFHKDFFHHDAHPPILFDAYSITANDRYYVNPVS